MDSILDEPIEIKKEHLSTDMERVTIPIRNLAKMRRIIPKTGSAQVLFDLSKMRDSKLIKMESDFSVHGVKEVFSYNVDGYMSDYHLWLETPEDEEILSRFSWGQKLYEFSLEESRKDLDYLYKTYSPRQLQMIMSIMNEYRLASSVNTLMQRTKTASFKEYIEKVASEYKLRNNEEPVAGINHRDFSDILQKLQLILKYANLMLENSQVERKNIRVSDIPNFLKIQVGYASSDDEKRLSELRNERTKDLMTLLNSCGMKEIPLFKLNPILHDYHYFIEDPSPFDNYLSRDQFLDCIKLAELPETKLFSFSPRVLSSIMNVISRYRNIYENHEILALKKRHKNFKKYTAAVTNEFRRPGYSQTVESIEGSQIDYLLDRVRTVHKYTCLVGL